MKKKSTKCNNMQFIANNTVQVHPTPKANMCTLKRITQQLTIELSESKPTFFMLHLARSSTCFFAIYARPHQSTGTRAARRHRGSRRWSFQIADVLVAIVSIRRGITRSLEVLKRTIRKTVNKV